MCLLKEYPVICSMKSDRRTIEGRVNLGQLKSQGGKEVGRGGRMCRKVMPDGR